MTSLLCVRCLRLSSIIGGFVKARRCAHSIPRKSGDYAENLSFRPYRVLRTTDASASLTAALFARLLVMRMLFEFAKQAALLQLQVEALQGAVDRLIGLNNDLNQITISSGRNMIPHASQTGFEAAGEGWPLLGILLAYTSALRRRGFTCSRSQKVICFSSSFSP